MTCEVENKEEGKETKDAKQRTDWELVEKHYRAGILTLMQMADIAKVTEGAIRKRAKRDNWSKDLTARIKVKTDELVRKNAVRKISTTKDAMADKEAIVFAAEVQSTIIIKQQGRIAKHLAISQAMLDELESQTIDRELYENLGEMMRAPDDKGMDKLNDLYKRVISTSSRIDSHKKAVETEKTLIALERQAFNIADTVVEQKTTEEMGEDDLNRAIAKYAAEAGISLTS